MYGLYSGAAYDLEVMVLCNCAVNVSEASLPMTKAVLNEDISTVEL